MVATTHTNGTVRNSPTINANVSGVQLITGYPGDPRAVPGAAQGFVAGAPGSFLPEGATVPANITALRALDIGEGDAWDEGDYIVIGTGNVHWDGEDWATGAAPAPG